MEGSEKVCRTVQAADARQASQTVCRVLLGALGASIGA